MKHEKKVKEKKQRETFCVNSLVYSDHGKVMSCVREPRLRFLVLFSEDDISNENSTEPVIILFKSFCQEDCFWPCKVDMEQLFFVVDEEYNFHFTNTELMGEVDALS